MPMMWWQMTLLGQLLSVMSRWIRYSVRPVVSSPYLRARAFSARPSSRFFSLLVVFYYSSLVFPPWYFVLFRFATQSHPRKSSPYGFAAGQNTKDEHFNGAAEDPRSFALSKISPDRNGTSANKCLRVAGTNYVCPAFNVLLTHAWRVDRHGSILSTPDIV